MQVTDRKDKHEICFALAFGYPAKRIIRSIESNLAQRPDQVGLLLYVNLLIAFDNHGCY